MFVYFALFGSTAINTSYSYIFQYTAVVKYLKTLSVVTRVVWHCDGRLPGCGYI
jgi:hypothetical protein